MNPRFETELGSGRLDLYGSATATPMPLLRITRIAPTPLVGRRVATIEVELENRWAPALDVDAHLLRGDTRNVRIVRRDAHYGDLATGERKVRVFEIVPRPWVEAGDPIHLRLRVRPRGGDAQLFDLRLHAAYFEDVSEDAAWEPVELFAAGVAFADYDGDGLTDFAQSPLLGPLTRYRNEGDGTFTPVVGPLSVFGPSPVFVDLDGDGDLDLLGRSASSRLYENDGAGGFSRVIGSALDGLQATELTPIDLDGDGDLDIVSVRRFFYRPPGATIFRAVDVLRNDGGFAFTSIWENTRLPGWMRRFLVTLDVDDDGLPDLFAAGQDTLSQGTWATERSRT